VNNVLAIFRRELAGSFGQPLAWIVLVLFLVLVAVATLGVDDVLDAGIADMRRPFLWIAACFVFVVPAVTMRLLADEQRSGGLELLVTLPLTSAEIVIGKWLSAVALVAVALGLTATWPIALALGGELDWGPVIGGYLGLLLIGAAYAAIGTLASALTPWQVLGFLVAFVACVLPWVLWFVIGFVPGESVPWVQYLTFGYHYTNLARGVLDTRSLVFYAGVTLLALQAAVLVLEHRRLG
jgi:ABC-2 type transport system permease protein